MVRSYERLYASPNTEQVIRLDVALYLTYWLNMDALSQTFSALADPIEPVSEAFFLPVRTR